MLLERALHGDRRWVEVQMVTTGTDAEIDGGNVWRQQGGEDETISGTDPAECSGT